MQTARPASSAYPFRLPTFCGHFVMSGAFADEKTRSAAVLWIDGVDLRRSERLGAVDNLIRVQIFDSRFG